MATSFTVNKADLEFVLRQIKIAEASSVAYDATPLTIVQAIQAEYGLTAANAAQSPFGLRTTDGSFNNTVPGQGFFGGADNKFPRLTDPVFRNDTDGDFIDRNGNGVRDPGETAQGNYGQNGNVVDADPRIISNLIVDMSVTNPAAIDAFLHNPLAVAAFEEALGFAPTKEWLTDPINVVAANTALQTIPNQSPDVGLTAGFNSWMTFFGQFFDHGLDFVVKGGNGTVLVPLMPDDPLITLGPDGVAGTNDEVTNPALQFMALTRAKTANGVVDGQTLNTTTSFVDQNQTYTSHSSHQVFLREYVKDANGRAVSSGKMLDGGHDELLGNKAGAIGNWAEVKAQAKEMLGLVLTDHDVLNVPLLLTDQYGQFIRGANGYAQVVTAVDATGKPTAWVEGTAAGLSLPINTVRTGHAFLDDIAHHAAPGFVDANHNGVMDIGEVLQTADTDPGMGDDGLADTYDDELLNAHFITGDGRGNENAALTAVHAVFHAEHNRLVDVNKATILASGDLAFINQWLVNDVTTIPTTPAQVDTLVWDGERLFQAARFATEMQYQHMVFEEFARRIQPMVDPFVFNTSPDVDPSVLAEFAHTVYRFGHSMLTGTVDRLDNNLQLINGETDQKTLLAMFLNPAAYLASGADMAEVNANLVRGLSRDVGNEIDEFIVNDLRSNLLGLPLDLAVLNLARGRETGIPSLNETRAQLYHDTGLTDLKPYTSWADFAEYLKNPMSIINFIAAYGTHGSITGATTLAAKRAAAEELVFGIDGPDADAVVAADRLAFLNGTGAYAGGRLGGLNDVDLWIGGLAEAKPEFGGMLGTTFNYVFEYQMENLQNGDRFYYLSRTQGTNFLNQLEPNTFADMVMRNTALGDVHATHLSGQLFVTPDLFLEQDVGIAQTDYNGVDDPLTPAIEGVGRDPTWADGELHPLTTPLKVTREGGTVVDGHTVGGLFKFYGPEHVVMGGTEGDDRIYSDKGDDTLWGDAGNDYLNGGTAADDVFGGDGDDIIEDPFGDDILRGEKGNDVISDSRGANILFGGEGQDYILVGQDATEVFAGSETDFVLGGNGKDFLMGNEGDDWVEGGGGFDTLVGENSELFFNSPIIGHDVLFGHGDETDYDAESGDDIMGSGPSVYRYEGMDGFDWGIAKFDTSDIHFDLQIPIFTNMEENVLRDRFDQVEGVSGWRGDDKLDGDDRGHSGGSSSPDSHPTETFTRHVLTQEGMERITGLQQLLGGASVTSFRNGNIMLGGDGNDTMRGRGGFDTIDGDAWLNVRIKIVHNGVTYSAESLTTDTVVAGPNAGKVFNTNPDGSPNFNSVAFGGRSLNSLMLDRTINPGEMSIVREIKDGTVAFGDNFNTSIENGYTDADATWTQDWVETGDGAPGTSNGGDIQIVSFNSSSQLNFNAGLATNDAITRSVDLSGAASGKLTFNWSDAGADADENISVEVWDGANWDVLGTLLGGDADGNKVFTANLSAEHLRSDGALRFRSVGGLTANGGENFYIDNISIGDNATDTDTAMFQGGSLEYEIEGTRIIYDATTGEALRRVNDTGPESAPLNIRDVNSDGFIRVKDLDDGLVAAPGRVGGLTVSRGALTDDVDLLKNIERLQFADRAFNLGGTTNSIATGIVTISDPTPYVLDHDNNPATPPLSVVSAYPGQVLTATLSNFADLDGIPIDPATGMPVGLTFDWETTEAGNDGGWAKITSGLTYTVRPNDPAHVLRAVAVFKDGAGVTERIASVQTDNVTATFSVTENASNGTVIAPVPFSLDYDPLGFGGTGVTDGDVVQLTHMIQPGQDAGGRFTVVNTGTAAAPVYQLAVANGGPQMLNYEAGVHTPANQSHQFADNQYQIVIDTYTDTIANGGVLMASRQFTILLNDVTGEVADIVPTLDLHADLTTTTTLAVDQAYRDNFEPNAYNNNNGASAWAGSWSETNDTGGATGGDVSVSASNLQFVAGTDGDEVLTRAVNLSGVTRAILTVNYQGDDLDGGENVVLEARNTTDPNGPWTPLTTMGGDAVGSFSAPLDPALVGANTQVRFRAQGTFEAGENLFIANINIRTETDTVTTVPGSPGTGYAASYTEGGAAVGIASNPAVTNDHPSIMSATIKLTNAQATDALSIAGTLPAGITSSFGPAIAGEITMYLTGNATLAAYQTAIQAVRFSNTGDNPNPTAAASPRTLQVTVNDGVSDSLIATATVTVQPVNDAPDAVNDAVITNVNNGVAFTIPEWALLANDIDPDSSLDVTAVAGATNLTGLSLAANPGSVTMTRTANGNASFTYTASDGASTDVATASVAQSLTTSTYADNFNSSVLNNSNGTTAWTATPWVEAADGANNAGTGQIQIDVGGTNELRFLNGDGATITRTVNLAGATTATLSFQVDQNGLDAGETVTVLFAADGVNFTQTIQTIATSSSSTGATTTVALTGPFAATSAIRFVATGITGAGEDVRIDDLSISYTTPNANIVAGDGNQILVGNGAGSTFDSGAGNDIVLAGDGNDTVLSSLGDDTVDGGTGDDTIHWTAPGTGTLHGWDVVNGGTEGAAGDTFVLTGNTTAETFRIYTAAEALLAVPNLVLRNPNSEIVITRTNTASGTVVVAELSEIEEIIVNSLNTTANNENNPNTPDEGSSGGDTIQVIGNFTGTSLNFNTITIDGQVGDDTIDIRALTSAHRIVFKSNGGNDTIIGTLRSQDVIELPAGAVAADYVSTTTNGVTTMTGPGGHKVTYTAAPGAAPVVGVGEDDEEEDDTSVPGTDEEEEGSGSGSGEENEEEEAEDDDDGGAAPTPPGSTPPAAAGASKVGTAQADVLAGTSGADTLSGLGGDDVASGGEGADVMRGGDGGDLLSAEGGNDLVRGGEGDDDVLGGDGADMLYGDEGDDMVLGESGRDLINAGAGGDTVFGGAGDDKIVAEKGDGDDIYYGDDMVGGLGNDTLDMSAITAGITADLGAGHSSSGRVASGQSGSDTLWGIENFVGGSGADTITAGSGVNVIDGGGGADTFRFLSAADAHGDTILGFQPGDKIDLGAMDAVSGAAGDQFTLVNGSGSLAVGQLRVVHKDGDTLIEGNVSGGAAPDFKLTIKGLHDLNGTDLNL